MLIHDFDDDSIEIKAITDTSGMLGVVQVISTMTMPAADGSTITHVAILHFSPAQARKVALAIGDKALQVDNQQYDPR